MADEELASLLYYHGLLHREDTKEMLVENGDWLLRLGEPSVPGERLIVLSVQTDKEASAGVKHVLVTKREDKLQLLGPDTFESIDSLIEFYKKTDIQFKGGITAKLARSITRQKWELAHADIVLAQKLGEGALGQVHKGVWTKRGEKTGEGKIVNVVIRLAKLDALTKEQIKEILREARMMRTFQHPNIIKLYGVAAGQEPLMLVMELATDGPLDSYLGKNELLPQGKRMEMICQAAWGVEYLHGNNCIHRDIAARNCLYGGGIVKISDFGLARLGETYQMNPKNKVLIRWLAPETLKTAAYWHKTDVWSWGVLVWEIFNNCIEPYHGMNMTEVLRFVKDGNHLDIGAKMNHKAVAKMIEKCAFAYMADDRWSMAAIVKALEKMVGFKQEHATDREGEGGDKTVCTSESGSSTTIGSHQATGEKSKMALEPRSEILEEAAQQYFETGTRRDDYCRLLVAHLQEALPPGILADQKVYVGARGDINGSTLLCQVDSEHVRDVRAHFWAAVAIHEFDVGDHTTRMAIQCRDHKAADELEQSVIYDGLKHRVILKWPKLHAWRYSQSTEDVVIYNCPPLLLRCDELLRSFFDSLPASIDIKPRLDGRVILQCSSVREAQRCKDLLNHFDVLGCRLATYDR